MRIKLVRDAILGTSAYGTDNTWSGSTLQTSLNNTYGAGTSWLGSSLNSLARRYIDDAVWYYGSIDNDITAANTNTAEKNGTTWVGKVGIINATDYAFASSSCRSTTTMLSSYDNCISSNWLHITSTTQWTMTQRATTTNTQIHVQDNGRVSGRTVDNTFGVRPAVYLSADVIIIGGGGTSVNPYILGLASSTLPSEYQQVEYLESSGTQYIDTGYYFQHENIKIALDGQLIGDSSNQSLFGDQEYTTSSGSSSNYSCIPNGQNGVYGIYVGRGNQGNVTLSTGNRFSLEITTTQAKLLTVYKDGTSVMSKTYSGSVMTKQNAYLSSNVSITVGNIFVFSNHKTDRGSVNSAIELSSGMRVYSFKIWDDEVLVRDMVPCYRKSDEVGGLYDMVNNLFYTNAGSGTFNIGSGTYVESTWNYEKFYDNYQNYYGSQRCGWNCTYECSNNHSSSTWACINSTTSPPTSASQIAGPYCWCQY